MMKLSLFMIADAAREKLVYRSFLSDVASSCADRKNPEQKSSAGSEPPEVTLPSLSRCQLKARGGRAGADEGQLFQLF